MTPPSTRSASASTPDANFNSTIDPRLAKAVSHPLRMQILTVLNQRVASPVEIAKELDQPLANVSYHTRMLERLKCIELVSETKRRGAIEHHYRALDRPILTTDDLTQIPVSVRRGIADGILTQIAKDLRSAAKRGGFDRHDVHLTRTPLALDEEGWQRLAERLLEVLDEAVAEQAAAAQRVSKRKAARKQPGKASEADGGAEPDTFAANLVMMFFEQPTSKRAGPAKRKASG